MLDTIPEEKTELIKDLQFNFENTDYKAMQWLRTTQTLAKHIPTPREDWEFGTLSILTSKSVEEVKEIFKNK
jgi:hypothetical protein